MWYDPDCHEPLYHGVVVDAETAAEAVTRFRAFLLAKGVDFDGFKLSAIPSEVIL